MRLNCGLTYEEEKAELSKWHKHFTLWPRRVGYRDCRWLETIERRKVYYEDPVLGPMHFIDGYWEYRPCEF